MTDYVCGPPCGCQECIEAGVEHEPTRRDPVTKEMLHGHALRRGLDAFKAFQDAARAAIGPRGRHGRMARLVQS
jgi:hypothetical protein